MDLLGLHIHRFHPFRAGKAGRRYHPKGTIYYMVTREGSKTWPLKFQKLEEVHNKDRGEIPILAYEIDKDIPTWGNYVSGLFKYLGCEKLLK